MKLRDYQSRIVEMARAQNILCALQPGSGKTTIGLHWMVEGMADGRFRRPLLIAPNTLARSVWPSEAEAWSSCRHLNFIHLGDYKPDKRAQALIGRPENTVCVVSPDSITWLIEQMKAERKLYFDAMIADEAQFFKNPESTRSRAMRGLASTIKGPGRIVLLSGSPTPNGPIDAWYAGATVTHSAEPWGKNYYAWRSRNFIKPPQGRFVWTPRQGTADSVNAELAKIGVSLTLRDCADVPPELDAWVDITMNEATHEAHDYILGRKDACNPFDFYLPSQESGDEAGPIIQALSQIASGFVYQDGKAILLDTTRFDAAVDFIESERPFPVLVPVRYRFEAEYLRETIPGAVVLSGETKMADRVRIISDWNDNKIPALIISPRAAGHGLNLQFSECRSILWFALPWSHELFSQTNARIVRSGQKNTITVARLFDDHLIDTAYKSVLDGKQSNEAALLAVLNLSRKSGKIGVSNA